MNWTVGIRTATVQFLPVNAPDEASARRLARAMIESTLLVRPDIGAVTWALYDSTLTKVGNDETLPPTAVDPSDELARLRTIARNLYLHLKALNDARHDTRYAGIENPCAGCYDAQYAYEAYRDGPRNHVDGQTPSSQ